MNPITLTLVPSRTLLMLYIGAGLAFGSMLFLVPLPYWLRLIIVSLILINLAYFSLRDALLLLPWSYTALNVNAKNQLKLVRRNGALLEAYVQKNTMVTAYLTVLNCQSSEAALLQRIFSPHLVILADAVDAENYRQLRVWLRWAKLGLHH